MAGDGSKMIQVTGTALQEFRVNAGGTAIESFTPASSGLTGATAPLGVSGSNVIVNANAIDTANLAKYLIQHIRVAITSAQVLLANTTTIPVVPAPGVGYFNLLICAASRLVFNSAAYATNTNGAMAYHNSPTNDLLSGALNINSLNTQVKFAGNSAFSSPESNVISTIDNQSIDFGVLTGNPTAGNSPIVVDAWYVVLKSDGT
jgi:hypothetical protein